VRVCWGVWSGLSGPFGPLAPVVLVLGIHGRPLFFPDLPRPWSLRIRVPTTALMLRRTNVDRPRSGGFQDQARLGLFVLPCGVFWASGACRSVLMNHGRPLCFHGLSLILGLAYPVELGRSPCSLRMRLEGLAGGSCLSPPWRAAGSVKSPASLPQIHQVEGICQVSFPYQGRYSPATWPVMLEDDGDDGGVDGGKTGCLLIGAVQDQAQFGCFVLQLGVSRASFGLLSRERFFLRDALGLPLAPPWGLGTSYPCGGPQAVSVFPFPNLILVST
jgi:hypothetical protein